MRAAPTFVVMFFLLNVVRDVSLFGMKLTMSGVMTVAVSLVPYSAAYTADAGVEALRQWDRGSPLVQMVGAGIGVTLIPEMAVPVETRSAPVSVTRFKNPQPSRTIGMVWRKTSPLAGSCSKSPKWCICRQARRASESARLKRAVPEPEVALDDRSQYPPRPRGRI